MFLVILGYYEVLNTDTKGRNKQNIIVLSSFIAIVFIMLLMVG